MRIEQSFTMSISTVSSATRAEKISLPMRFSALVRIRLTALTEVMDSTQQCISK